MDAQDIIWNIDKICKYKTREDHCDGVEYSRCELLVDFGPFKKGEVCSIHIDSRTHGDFTMTVRCEGLGAMFVPAWTHVRSDTI